MLKRKREDYSKFFLTINIKNINYNSWQPNNKNFLFLLLGIISACDLKESQTSDMSFAISFFSDIINSKNPYLPLWLLDNEGKIIESYQFQNYIDELKKISTANTFVKQSLNIPHNTTDFSFQLFCPSGSPQQNPKSWKKMCFILKLLWIYYNKETIYPFDNFSLCGLHNKKLKIIPQNEKQNIVNIIINHFHNILPIVENPRIIYKYPDYLPPDLEIHEPIETIKLRRLVWYHFLAHIGNHPEVDKEGITKGISVLVHKFQENQNPLLLEVISICLKLLFTITYQQ